MGRQDSPGEYLCDFLRVFVVFGGDVELGICTKTRRFYLHYLLPIVSSV